MMVWEATDRLSQGTEKEAHFGVERIARIHRRSFDYSGVHTASMASVQIEERA